MHDQPIPKKERAAYLEYLVAVMARKHGKDSAEARDAAIALCRERKCDPFLRTPIYRNLSFERVTGKVLSPSEMPPNYIETWQKVIETLVTAGPAPEQSA